MSKRGQLGTDFVLVSSVNLFMIPLLSLSRVVSGNIRKTGLALALLLSEKSEQCESVCWSVAVEIY